LRQAVLPLIRAETPPLNTLQNLIRSPILDSYFAFAANLGTHTFFMIFLPILFWCGCHEFGRALVNLLAAGVIISGIIKDILCLPRPMSPPLHRITMSGSAALEYGFPSTHSTNAVSVALYAIHVLNSDFGDSMSPETRQMWIWAFYIYAFSIGFGRIYCGMHGFLDVVVGSTLGALLTYAQIHWGERLHNWVVEGPIFNPLILMLVIFFIVRTHPEPADDCPCYDDSVAFSGVLVGINWAYWHVLQPHALLPMVKDVFPYITEVPLGVPFLTWKTLVRIPLGVVIIVASRSITKPFLLKVLPPLFRTLEYLDLDLPRRFFLKSSQYRKVPSLRRDDNVLPNPSEVGQMLSDVRAKRGRAISVGPQSMADAREVLAYRQEARRRERSLSAESRDGRLTRQNLQNGQLPRSVGHSRNTSDDFAIAELQNLSSSDEESEIKERRVVFSAIPHIRVRYDVEVVTKLIVYAGIGWWALEGCVMIFEVLHLGTGSELIA